MEIKSSENLSMKNMLGIFNKSQTSDFLFDKEKEFTRIRKEDRACIRLSKQLKIADNFYILDCLNSRL